MKKLRGPGAVAVSPQRRRRVWRENLTSYAFLLPWLAFLLVFTAYPFLYGFVISLFDYTLRSEVFVGLDNYRSILGDRTFWNALAVTVKYIAIIIPCTVLVSLLVAYAVQNTRRWFQTAVKLVFYMTSIVSQVALVMVWKWMFNPSYGLYATLTQKLGWVRLDLLGNADYSIPLMSLLVLGFTVSQPIVLFSAAMDAVPTELYDAADLDGAARFTQFRKITIPCIAPTLLFVLVTTTINNLQVFVVPYLLTNGGPNGRTTPILLLVYRNAFEFGKYGYASAMGVLLFFLIAILVALQFRMQTHRD